jgi:DNA mismatch repair protein MutL
VFLKSIDVAYKNLIGIGKYPFVVLNLEIPPSDIDVNVHPTKKEVRYKNPNQIFNFIQHSILNALQTSAPRQNEEATQGEQNNWTASLPSATRNDDDECIYLSDKNSAQKLFVSPPPTVIKYDEPPAPSLQENIIGQYKNTYILIEQPDGLEIVDQHIAHERYLYETMRKDPISQMLFVSDVIKISVIEAALIKENLEKFGKFGYEIEFLNEDEIVFRKVPQSLARVSTKEILADILENLETDLNNLEEKILITSSCKAAVKAGEKLSTWQMQELIKNWRTTKMPYTCPHGRPISKIIAHDEIAKFFQRPY